MTEEDARDDLREEIGDVRLCIRVLDEAIGDVINSAIVPYKLTRWIARIRQAKERNDAENNDTSGGWW